MKSKIFIGLFLMLILVTHVSLASYSTVTMSVVEEPICTIGLGQNSKFEKKLISKDLANKEVTLQLQVTNEEIADKPTGEIMLVLDNSNSMTVEISENKTRKDAIVESANSLISNLLKDNTALKIGVVSFSSNTDYDKEGTIEDASLVLPLSNNASTLTNAISNIEMTGTRTNLQSGLVLANQQFSDEKNNKYMIVLTDGVPNIAIDYQIAYYSDDVIEKTNQQLKTLDNQGIEIITMLTEIKNGSTVPNTTDKTFDQIIEEIFGTPTNPTAGKFYYTKDADIEQTITNDIYNDLVPIEKTLKDITVVDYFPAEIVKNFAFAYVSKANIGNISSTIDTKNNSITWTIPELTSGQTATVQYKLKLKENFDSSIIDKVLNTNQKVDIKYTDVDDKIQTKTSDISPKLLLEDTPVVLPKAGNITFIGFVVFATGLLIYTALQLLVFHKKTN